jgi:hypothetical protein
MALQADALPTLSTIPSEVVSQQEEITKLMSEKSTQFLLNSRQMFARAFAEYKRLGLGAFYIQYPSLDHLRANGTVDVMYSDLCRLMMLNYPHACNLVRTYNPLNSFVLVVGVQIKHPSNVFSSCVVTSDAELRVNENVRRSLHLLNQQDGVTNAREVLDALGVTQMPSMVSFRQCAQCNRSGRGLLLCDGCKQVVYCNAGCQRSHWAVGHHAKCSHLLAKLGAR